MSGARLFVALLPPTEVVEELDAFLEPRRAADPDLRWSRAEQWHLTLAFMPSVTPRAGERLEEALEDVAAQASPVDLTLRGAGAFPGVADARVLWLGVDDPLEDLPPLARRCRSAASVSGAPVQGGDFRPHLTLARLRRPRDVRRWVQVVETFVSTTWTADELVLVESHLGQGPGGTPRYAERLRLPLG